MKPNFFILKLISLPEKPKSSRGFTLTELLIAASLTLIVIGAAGFGLYQTMRGSKTGNNQAERRSEIARAYEFVSDEMRKARLIFGNNKLIDPNTADNDNEYLNRQVTSTANAPFYTSGTTTVATDSNVVLALKIPVTNAAIDQDGNANNEATIVYYVKDAPTGSVWKGPKILYRWGPPIDNSGEYTNNGWVSQPLIDQLKNENVNPTCTAGWNQSSAPGFAACIDPQGRVAQIYLNGEIVTAEGNKDYLGKTKTAARANDQTAINITSLATRNYGLGGEFKCHSSRTTIGVDTTLDFYDNPSDTTAASTETIKGGGSSKRELNSTNKIKVTSTATGCPTSTTPVFQAGEDRPVSVEITFNTPAIDNTTDPAHPRPNFVDPNNAQVLVLYDYKDISSYNTQYEDQQTLKEYLKSKGVEFYVEGGTETNKIKLNPHQLLLAFEIGQTSATIGSPPIANPGWDFQDNLVLLNVK